MSRKPMLVTVAIVALVLLVAFGGRIAGSIERTLLALHGRPHLPSASAAGSETHQGETSDALAEGWPATPVGRIAGDWVDAYAGGEESMRTFLSNHVSSADLAEGSMEDRLGSYRGLRERLGSLLLASVEASSDDELTAVLVAEDASRHRFVFTVDKDPPHHLLRVGLLQHGHGHGGASGSH